MFLWQLNVLPLSPDALQNNHAVTGGTGFTAGSAKQLGTVRSQMCGLK